MTNSSSFFTPTLPLHRTRKALRNKRFLQGVVVVLVIANILVFIADVKKKLGKRKNP